MKHALLLLVLVAGFQNLGFAAKKQKEPKKKPIIFVLKKCQIKDQFDVLNPEGKRDHTELVCECSMRSQKLDAKTGKLIVECE